MVCHPAAETGWDTETLDANVGVTEKFRACQEPASRRGVEAPLVTLLSRPGSAGNGAKGGALGEGKQRRRTGTSMDQHVNVAPNGSGRVPGEPSGNDVQSHIGRQLRAIYDGVVAQPVPDRFLELLNELEKNAADRQDGTGGSDPLDKS